MGMSVKAMFQTDNPALRYGRFDEAEYSSPPSRRGGPDEQMTTTGAVDRTALLLIMTAAAAAYTWQQVYAGLMTGAAVMAWMQGSGICGFVAALAITFKPNWSPYLAPVYAITKGLALGGMSALLEIAYPGVVVQALTMTFGTLFALLAGFRTKLISVNEGFRSAVGVATGGFFIGILAMMALRMFGVAVPFMASGAFGIGVSLVSVGLAASNLLLDFDTIQETAYYGAPKWMEWYSGFSLLITLVWMYTSILRLLTAFAGSNSD